MTSYSVHVFSPMKHPAIKLVWSLFIMVGRVPLSLFAMIEE